MSLKAAFSEGGPSDPSDSYHSRRTALAIGALAATQTGTQPAASPEVAIDVTDQARMALQTSIDIRQ